VPAEENPAEIKVFGKDGDDNVDELPALSSGNEKVEKASEVADATVDEKKEQQAKVATDSGITITPNSMFTFITSLFLSILISKVF
jgi:hypothetical protein